MWPGEKAGLGGTQDQRSRERGRQEVPKANSVGQPPSPAPLPCTGQSQPHPTQLTPSEGGGLRWPQMLAEAQLSEAEE